MSSSIWATFKESMQPWLFKNRPIWSHCCQPTYSKLDHCGAQNLELACFNSEEISVQKIGTFWAVVVAQLVERSLLSAVRIQSSAKIYLFMLNICFLSTVYWKDENKRKRGRGWPIFLKKTCNECFSCFKWANPALFFIYFRLFKHTLQFLKQTHVKNVHPVYGIGILTQDLWYMSLLP